MRAIYYRALPSDFETHAIGSVEKYRKAIADAVDDLDAALKAPVNTPKFLRDEVLACVNSLRKVLDS